MKIYKKTYRGFNNKPIIINRPFSKTRNKKVKKYFSFENYLRKNSKPYSDANGLLIETENDLIYVDSWFK